MPNADRSILGNPNRINEIKQFCISGTSDNVAFDRLTKLATKTIKAPVSLVSCVDIDRQIFMSQVGLPEPWATSRETPLSHSFCQHVVATGEPLIIENALTHPLVYDNLAIKDLNVLAYAGIPLEISTGHILGSFCVIDSKPRDWTEEEIDILKNLAASAITEIELQVELSRRREAEERYRIVSELSSDYSYAFKVTEEGDLERIWMTNAFTNVTGYTLDEIDEMGGWTALIHPDDLDAASELLKKLLHDAQRMRWEYRIFTKSGQVRHIESHFLPFYDVDYRRVTRLYAVAKDITEIHVARNRELEHAVKKNRIEILESFIEDAAHEFRTPLASISSSAYLIGKIDDADRKMRYVNQIQKHVEQITKLVDALGMMSHLDSNNIYNPTWIELNSLVSEVADGLMSHAIDKKLTMNYRPSDTDIHILGSAQELSIAFSHVIDNAIRYTDTGNITVSLERVDNQCLVRIKDTGIGITPDHIPNVFKRFYRADAAHTTRGFGLGLSIAEEVIHRHKGTIEIEQSSNQGTTILIQLPVQDTQPIEQMN